MLALNIQVVELGTNRLHLFDKIAYELRRDEQQAFEFMLWQALDGREAHLKERIADLKKQVEEGEA